MTLQLAAVLVAATWLMAAWTRGVIGGRRDREQAAVRFARTAGLPVQDPPDAELVRRVVRRHRFVVGGAFAGFAAAFVVPESVWTGLSLLYVGLAAGAVLARLTEAQLPSDSPRVAHATETRLTDYVPPWIVLLVPLAAIFVVALAAYVLATREPAPPGPPPDVVVEAWRQEWIVSTGEVVGAAAACVATAVTAGLLARLVVRRRRASASTAALAVDDALRAGAVRDCLQLSAAATFSAVLAISAALTEPDAAGAAARRVGGWAPVALLAALALVHVLFQATHGARWWRRRLHPELAAA